ncbi:MAG TPA: hypothetical protein VMD51_13615, partial [Mycobacterium sp.]|nr:hypothetical protein [Mycobacterium sp.]
MTASATTTFEPPTTGAPTPETAATYRLTRGERIEIAVLLLATAVMYLWNITVNGMGNQFYAG